MVDLPNGRSRSVRLVDVETGATVSRPDSGARRGPRDGHIA